MLIGPQNMLSKNSCKSRRQGPSGSYKCFGGSCSFTGNHLHNINLRLDVQCHSTLQWICVAILPYNDIEYG